MASLESAAEESGAVSSSTASTSQSTKSKKEETNKRRVLTLIKKYQLVNAIGKAEKCSFVAKRFDPPLSQSTTSTILKMKEECTKKNERR